MDKDETKPEGRVLSIAGAVSGFGAGMQGITMSLALILLSGCNLFSDEGEFWSRVSAKCGHIYNGHIIDDEPANASGLAGASLQLDVGKCSSDLIEMDFLIDGKVDATWRLRKHDDMLEFRQIREAGLSGYGGFSAENSSGSRQNFPADALSRDMFAEAGLDDEAETSWALEARAGSLLAYEMSRPGRLFFVEFYTTNPAERFTPSADK